MPEFLNPADAEFWVGVGLLIFLGIVVFVAKAPQLIAKSLDATTATIQGDLDEAARIREEAHRLLESLRAERIEAEAHARDMLAAAEEDAKRYALEAKAKLEESLTRRQQMAERKIATAEAQAMADVRAAAVDRAAQAAEAVLTARLAGAKSDPLVDRAISQLGAKLQ